MGRKPTQIAQELDIDVKTVYKDIQTIKTNWMTRATAAYGLHVAEELARLDAVEQTALDRLEAAPKATIGLLRVIIECVKQRRELLGLDRPKRMELSGPDGGPLNVRELTDAELLVIAGGASGHLTAGGGGGVAGAAAGAS